MFIITDYNNLIIYITENLERREDGDYLVDNDVIISARAVKSIYDYSEEIPEYVKAGEYYYTREKGFYQNRYIPS